jgi:hypothetical protein
MADAMTPEQAVTQANTCASVQRQLQAQQNIGQLAWQIT